MSRMEKKTTLKLSPITFKDAKDFITSEASGNRILQAISFKGTGGHILRGKWAL